MIEFRQKDNPLYGGIVDLDGLGVSFAVDCATSRQFELTLDANKTVTAINNLPEGYHVEIMVTQDATGSRTLTFPGTYNLVGSIDLAVSAITLLQIRKVGTDIYVFHKKTESTSTASGIQPLPDITGTITAGEAITSGDALKFNLLTNTAVQTENKLTFNTSAAILTVALGAAPVTGYVSNLQVERTTTGGETYNLWIENVTTGQEYQFGDNFFIVNGAGAVNIAVDPNVFVINSGDALNFKSQLLSGGTEPIRLNNYTYVENLGTEVVKAVSGDAHYGIATNTVALGGNVNYLSQGFFATANNAGTGAALDPFYLSATAGQYNIDDDTNGIVGYSDGAGGIYIGGYSNDDLLIFGSRSAFPSAGTSGKKHFAQTENDVYEYVAGNYYPLGGPTLGDVVQLTAFLPAGVGGSTTTNTYNVPHGGGKIPAYIKFSIYSGLNFTVNSVYVPGIGNYGMDHTQSGTADSENSATSLYIYRVAAGTEAGELVVDSVDASNLVLNYNNITRGAIENKK